MKGDTPFKRRNRTDALQTVAGDVELIGRPIPWERRPDNLGRVLFHVGEPDAHDWEDARDHLIATLKSERDAVFLPVVEWIAKVLRKVRR